MDKERTFTAFTEDKMIKQGDIVQVIIAAKKLIDNGDNRRIVCFDDCSGYLVDIDYRGNLEEVLKRLDEHPLLKTVKPKIKKNRGRPKLGVVSKEVTLLPRHWEWLNEQPGGASATLRKLVEEAKRRNQSSTLVRKGKEAIHRFMWEMTANRENFEEASRSFYAKDYDTFNNLIANWPEDIQNYLKEKINKLKPLELQAALQAK